MLVRIFFTFSASLSLVAVPFEAPKEMFSLDFQISQRVGGQIPHGKKSTSHLSRHVEWRSWRLKLRSPPHSLPRYSTKQPLEQKWLVFIRDKGSEKGVLWQACACIVCRKIYYVSRENCRSEISQVSFGGKGGGDMYWNLEDHNLSCYRQLPSSYNDLRT